LCGKCRRYKRYKTDGDLSIVNAADMHNRCEFWAESMEDYGIDDAKIAFSSLGHLFWDGNEWRRPGDSSDGCVLYCEGFEEVPRKAVLECKDCQYFRAYDPDVSAGKCVYHDDLTPAKGFCWWGKKAPESGSREEEKGEAAERG